MKVLIVGYGSIGRRHADVLIGICHDVGVVSRRAIGHTPNFASIEEAANLFAPDYVIIASRTVEHREDIEALSTTGFKGRLLIEKPVYDSGSESPPSGFEFVKVAFNLRFHPALLHLRKLIAGRKIYAATVYTGSYLPSWRPDRDYRASYSAIRAEGGGVLRDLSHELDYTMWLFGQWQSVATIGGRFGDLDIDSDDVFAMLLKTERAPAVTVNVNYLDTETRRELTILTDQGTIHADLINGVVRDYDVAETFTVERNDTYIAQHQAMIANDSTVICDISEGLNVMRLIAAAEHAAAEQCWVSA